MTDRRFHCDLFRDGLRNENPRIVADAGIKSEAPSSTSMQSRRTDAAPAIVEPAVAPAPPAVAPEEAVDAQAAIAVAEEECDCGGLPDELVALSMFRDEASSARQDVAFQITISKNLIILFAIVHGSNEEVIAGQLL